MKSASSVISHSTATPDWQSIRAMEPAPAAERLGCILRSLDGNEKRVFAWRGMCALLIEERELWREFIDEEVDMPFASFDKFLKSNFPNSHSYIRDALRAVKELKDLSFADLLMIRRSNLEQLKKVSSNVRLLPEVVKAAKEMPEKQFVSKMNESFGQALDVKQPIAMAPADDCEEFETALALAVVVEGCSTRGEAIKCVSISYIQDHAVEAEHLKEETA